MTFIARPGLGRTLQREIRRECESRHDYVVLGIDGQSVGAVIFLATEVSGVSYRGTTRVICMSMASKLPGERVIMRAVI